jgi:hypothetical protein
MSNSREAPAKAPTVQSRKIDGHQHGALDLEHQQQRLDQEQPEHQDADGASDVIATTS